jgi:hypothetical protein
MSNGYSAERPSSPLLPPDAEYALSPPIDVSKILYAFAPMIDTTTVEISTSTKIIDETRTNGSQLAGQLRMPEHNHALVAP